jgi:hypothetical protein
MEGYKQNQGPKMPLPTSPESEEPMGYEEIDRNALRKLQQLSAAGATLFEELQNPSMSAEEFFDKIGAFNDQETKERAGTYRSVSVALGEYRNLTVKIFDNGRVTFSGGDHNPERLAKSQEGESFSIPEAGDSIVLRKRSVHSGKNSEVSEGEASRGKLLQSIALGQSIRLDNNATTSRVQAMRIENGVLIVETETSTYEISKDS